MRKIIVRADDLGFSEGINYGIEKSVKEGIIKSVGFMVNMPASLHGYNLIKDSNVCLGLHTNICVGKPLTDPSKIPSICDESGNLKASKVYRSAKEDFVNLDEVILEIEAQYQKFVEITGQKPHYFEGHAVCSDNFFKGMEIVAKAHGCDYLPVGFNGPVKFRNTMLYTSLDSMKPEYDPYKSLKQAALTNYPDNGLCMFVCHPGYLDAYILKTSSLLIPRAMEVEMLCDKDMKQWLKENEIEVISYDEVG
ncbi:ChbG/HpnK family deacetylase [Floccifex sp.]|uniref:ChbG/HpnK family deacetylase n=1 Tax=Floccifex sp. TaxID=2815810 RepID=UPI002A759FE3|nr:ChbG/HpnK family deacetylase [Floccifex sp.]MDD7282060.1 ChbG/HpnK family deacetylase [Erysipelotrichaceae bacterium]MDY2958757.1 ChbG/HpnK family deacetylase [Floccifex sp.]